LLTNRFGDRSTDEKRMNQRITHMKNLCTLRRNYNLVTPMVPEIRQAGEHC